MSEGSENLFTDVPNDTVLSGLSMPGDLALDEDGIFQNPSSISKEQTDTATSQASYHEVSKDSESEDEDGEENVISTPKELSSTLIWTLQSMGINMKKEWNIVLLHQLKERGYLSESHIKFFCMGVQAERNLSAGKDLHDTAKIIQNEVEKLIEVNKEINDANERLTMEFHRMKDFFIKKMEAIKMELLATKKDGLARKKEKENGKSIASTFETK